MALSLVLLALVIIVCIAANKFSNKIGIPTLLIFIGFGMLCGTDGIVGITFDDYGFSEQVCSIALMFIIFYGGFGTNWKVARPVAGKSLALSSAGTIITAALTGIFCHFVLGFGLIESFLVGAVISSTDAASVFSVLRSQRLNLKNGTASMLEIESGSNDPFAYMLTVILLQFVGSKGASIQEILTLVFSQLVFACIIGSATAFFGILILKKVKFPSEGLDTVFVLAIAILSYALPLLINGNGYLSVYLCGLILGNSKINNKVPLVNFFDGITGLAQIVIFFLLGLLSTPSQMLPILLPSAAIALFLTFVARPLAVFSIMTPLGCSFRQQLLVAWSGLRGAASIVFAIFVMTEYNSSNDIFHIVFCVSLFSVAFQGTLLPKVARKLNMVDNSTSVLKTFNDYQDESDLNLIKLKVTPGLKWAGKPIKKVHMPVGTLIVMIKRGEEVIIPNGSTVLECDDILILSVESYEDDTGVALKEVAANSHAEWFGKAITDLNLPDESLIIMIKRQGHILVPKGTTKIRKDDVLVFSGLD